MAITRPPFIGQRDDTRCQWDNCALAAHAMAIWRHLEGINPQKIEGAPWPPKPSYLRNKLTPTTCGGTSLNPDNAFLAREYYGVAFEYRYDLPWEDFVTLVRSGRGAVIRIDYTPLHGTKFDHSPNFNGTHQVYVNEVRSDGYLLVGDPVAYGFAWWPAWLLKKAAGQATGEAGLVDANFTRDTEGQMIPITDETPKYLTASVGKQLYYTDGTKYRLTTSKITNRLSPYGTTVAGIDYRIIRAVSGDKKYVFMLKETDVSLRPVILGG